MSAEAAIQVTAVDGARTRPRRRRDIHRGDRRFSRLMRAAALAAAGLLAAIALQVGQLAWPALQKFGAGYFVGTDWNPVTGSFGALSFIYGTLVSSALALAISLPVSVGVALFLTELAPRRVARLVGFGVEMLAAIPSVVFGLWGIFVLAPALRVWVQPWLAKHLGFLPLFQGAPYGVGMLSAGVVLAIMITPTIAAITREVFRAIPRASREAALALGATRWEAMQVAVLKAARPGILGAAVLGLGRAMGETMAVTMVIGNRAEISASLFAPAQTMASVLANEYAEAADDLHMAALAGVGLALFAVSLAVNGVARYLVWRAERVAGGAA